MDAIRNLAAAVLLQATKDYLKSDNNGKKAIIKDLKSDWMLLLTDGQSEVIAEKLQTDAKAIRKRLKMEETKCIQ